MTFDIPIWAAALIAGLLALAGGCSVVQLVCDWRTRRRQRRREEEALLERLRTADQDRLQVRICELEAQNQMLRDDNKTLTLRNRLFSNELRCDQKALTEFFRR